MSIPAMALDDDELAKLDELVEIYSGEESGYDIERLDGLFAALAVSPVLIPPSRYLPVIRGEPAAEDAAAVSANESPAGSGFATVEQMQEFMLLLMRHSNSVMHELRNPKQKKTDYLPVIFPDEVYETPEEAGKFLGVSWALGFVDGMQLFADDWDAAVEDSPALEQLELMITSLLMDGILQDESAEAKIEAAPAPDGEAWTTLTLDDRIGICADLPQAIKDATMVFAQEHRQARSAQTIVRGEKVGRNDPCPCGSGKKHKQCCGK